MQCPITINNALPIDKLNRVREKLHRNWRLSGYSIGTDEVPFWSHGSTHGKEIEYWDAGLHLKLILQKHLRVALQMENFRGNLATATQEGSSFHIDSNYDDRITAVVYGTPEWDVQWGGETVVFDGHNYHYGTFIPNSCYVFPSHWEHYGASPNVRAKNPRITFAFMYRVCYNYPITTN